MFAASLATLFFAISIIYANRSVRACGARTANLGRLGVAIVLLGLFAHTFGTGFTSVSTPWLLVSGMVGMGVGDLAVFAALPLLGSRLTVLMVQCLAAPIAALCEWLWLDTRLTGAQVAWGTVILGGVALALMPSRRNPPRVPVKTLGFFFGFIGALGQGLGAVITRQGVFAAAAAGEPTLNGITAAYHRMLGGLGLVLLFFLVLALLKQKVAPAAHPEPRGWRWYVANALAGPVIGVSCYQWALASAPSGVVLPIVATTPLVAIPLAYWLEGDRPSRRSVIGGIVAVAGCIGLTLVR
jgi:drug/metabolite transporter (DMT)-like permease